MHFANGKSDSFAEYYSDLTQEGLPAGRWWVVEPQFTLAGQAQHSSWFAEWKMENAALVGRRVNI